MAEEKQSLVKLAAIACVYVAALLAVIAFSNALIAAVVDSVRESSYDNLMSSTKIIGQSIDDNLSNDYDQLVGFADSVSNSTQEDILVALPLYGATNNFLATYYVDENGVGYDFKGNPISVEKLPEPGVSYDGDAQISKPYLDESGYMCLLMRAPLIDENGVDRGAIYTELIPQRYYSESVFAFWEGSGRAFVVDVDHGSWIIKAPTSSMLPTRSDSVYKSLEELGNDEALVSQIKDCSDQGGSGVFEITNGSAYSFICLTPSTMNPDWTIMTILPSEVLDREADDIMTMLRITQFVLVVGLAVIFGVLLVYMRNRNRKNIERLRREHEEQSRAQEKRLSEIAMREYDFQTVVNLETMQAKTETYRINEHMATPQGDSVFSYPDYYGMVDKHLDPADIPCVDACIAPEQLLKEYDENLPSAPSVRYRFVSGDTVVWMECSVFFSRVNDTRYAYLMNKDVTVEATAQQKIERANEEKERRLVELQRLRDTLQEALRATEQANSAKTRFLSNMSHDIRTPMNAIVGMTAIAANEIDDPDKVRECLTVIKRSSNHLLDLINDVLDMSKIESGKLTLTSNRFSLTEAFDQAAAIVRPLCDEKNQTLVESKTITHDSVIGDMTRLDQVLINLLNNASKFTHNEGTIEFSMVEVPNQAPDYASFRFAVSDNGIGIAEESLGRVFEAFEREAESEANKIEGTGLGLAISKSITQAMGGSIDVESELGAGTTFTAIVSFRIDDAQEDEGALIFVPALASRGDPGAVANLAGKRFLVAEDHRINQLIARNLLEGEGATIDIADDGEHAVDAFVTSEAGTYDAILMDVRMPILDGYAATKAIRESGHPSAKSIPIIAMTANAFAEDRENAWRSGMNAHVSKPIDVETLKRTLGRLGLE